MYKIITILIQILLISTAIQANELIEKGIQGDFEGFYNIIMKKQHTVTELSSVYSELCENIDDTRFFKLLLDSGINIDTEYSDNAIDDDPGSYSCLYKSVFYQKWNTAKFLIENGADTNYRSLEEDSPIFSAIWNDNIEVVNMLLKYGASTEISDNTGATPLSYAIEKGNIKMIEILLNAGAQGNKNILFLAKKNKNIPKKLLKLMSTRREYELFTTVKNKDFFRASKLINLYPDSAKRTSINSENIFLYTVRVCDESSDTLCFLDLLNNKFKLTERDKELLLNAAIQEDKSIFVKKLLKFGFNQNYNLIYDYDAIMSAIRHKSKKSFHILIENCKDVNKIHDSRGQNYLNAAIFSSNDISVINRLISLGANIEDKDINSMTPLLMATYFGYLDAEKILIENGADLNTRDIDGETYFLYRAYKTRHDKSDSLSVLSKKNIDINIIDNNGENALHNAIYGQSENNVDELIMLGLDIEHKDKLGNTPLLHAFVNDKAGAIYPLICAGARLDIKNNNGDSILSIIHKKFDNKKYEKEFINRLYSNALKTVYCQRPYTKIEKTTLQERGE